MPTRLLLEGLGETGDAAAGTSPLLQRGAGSGPHLTDLPTPCRGPSTARYTPPTVMTLPPTVMMRRLGGHQAVWRGRERAFSLRFYAVMMDLQPLGQDPDRRRPAALEPLELQENEILLRLHSGCAGRHLADTQELSNPIPQLGESRVVDDTVSVATPACPNHYGIIS